MEFRTSPILIAPTVNYNHVINLTAREICFYDTNGNIAVSSPGSHSDLLDKLTPNTMVICESHADITIYQVPEKNAVLVDHTSTGRLGISVSRLMRVSDKAKATFTPERVVFNIVEIYHV